MQDGSERFIDALINAGHCDGDDAGQADFSDCATNVYRTRNYIVKQRIVFSEGRLGVTTVSDDVFYERTPERDGKYEDLFGDRLETDGRRVPAMGYIRRYVK